MGLFDFLNPKKKIEKLLSERVLPKIVPRARELINKYGEEKAKEQIQALAADEMRVHASELIPSPLQRYQDQIIDKAAGAVADKAIAETKARKAS